MSRFPWTKWFDSTVISLGLLLEEGIMHKSPLTGDNKETQLMSFYLPQLLRLTSNNELCSLHGVHVLFKKYSKLVTLQNFKYLIVQDPT